ncbi:MAG: FkbM family methyltransferase [Desulfobulbaceae bacterium]|nr:FkbM family methyltransferase [Desulfobulbaceae bacterium]
MKTIKKIIKKALYVLGIGTYNIKNSRRYYMSEALDHLVKMSFSPKTVIDVGVAYGTNDLYEKFPKAGHLLIEPLEEYKGVLEKISKKYHAQYELAAAGAVAGSIEINVHPDLSGSSVFKENEESDVNGKPRQVKMITLDDVCGSRKLSGPFLIKLDTQGFELNVLEGAKKILDETEVIILEVSFFRFYQYGPQFFEIVKWMKDHGFVAYDLFGGQNRPLDGALAQIDMVFVKENSYLRKDHFYATRDQREKHTKLVSEDNPK